MRKYTCWILFCFITILSQAQKRELSYQFTYDTASATLSVRLKMTGTDSGKTYIHLPDQWASQHEFYKAITFLSINTPGATLDSTSDPAIKKITHQPGDMLVIEYGLKQDWSGKLDYPMNFRAVLNKNYMQLTGYSLFILPKVDSSLNYLVHLDWSGMPAHWKIANSLHTQTKTYNGRLRLADFQNTFYVAGDFRISRSNVDGKPVWLAARGNDFKYTDALLLDKIKSIIKMERSFWQDNSESYYLVSLIPFEVQGGYNGSSLYQSFMLAMSTGFGLEVPVYRLLAHEYFHRWNGTAIILKGKEEENAWFAEGFTDYYTYKLLYTSGIISLPDYVNEANKIISDYYLSPVRNVTKEVAGANFWVNRDYNDLPYRKGFTYALYLDHLIRTNSLGKYSLDNVMHDLYKDQKANKIITEASVLEYFNHYAGKDITSLHRSFISEGNTIPVVPGILGYGVRDTTIELSHFDIGFDLDSTTKLKRIVNVEPGSEAWNAGLRNDQKYAGHSIYYDNIYVPSEIFIEENGIKRSIKYRPMGPQKIKIPQFKTP